MPMYCDNQAAMFIANNLTFHLYIMYLDIACHVVHHRILDGLINTPYVASSDQLPNIFTKGLNISSYDAFSHKLGLIDIYTPA